LVTGGAATIALGQPNLSSNTASNGGLSATTLNGPTGLAFDSSGNIWLADLNNNRVMEFQNVPTTTLTSSNPLSTGSNTFSLGNFQTTFQINNAFTNTNIDIQQVDINPETSSPPGITLGEFYQVKTNAPDIISSRTVTISYTKFDATNFDESSLKIYRFSGVIWTALPTTVDTTHHTVTATTPGFSTFVISGNLKPNLIIGNPTGAGEFYQQVGVTADSSGNIYVADTGNNRI
jgi:hypothetical protein